MTRKILKLFKWALFVSVFFVTVLIVLLLTLNFNSFKGRIEAKATDILEQPVHIKGDIKFSMIGWRPAFVLNDVIVRSNGEKPPVIKAERLTVSLLILESPQRFFARVRGLTFNNHQLGDYDVPLRIYATGFDSRGMKGEMAGAKLSGDVSYLNDKFRVRLDINDLPYRRIAEGAEGKINGKIQLDGKGSDPGRIMRTLEGNFTLIGGAGTLTSKAVNSWTRGLLSTIFVGQRDETKLNCTLADFKITNGIAHSRAIIVDTEEVAIYGKGSVDLNRQTVNMTLSPKPKSASLVSLTTPVHMTGPVDNVIVTPVGGAMAKKFGGMLLGIVNPAMFLLPLVEMGSWDSNNPCVKSLKKKKTAAP